MPVHDWTRVDAGLFHAFRLQWVCAVCDAFDSGVLPPDYFALPDQRSSGSVHDVLKLRQLSSCSEARIYAERADRIAIRHKHGEVVAVVEIASPGNKGSTAEVRTFVEKSVEFIRQGIHLVVVDLFPPSRRGPQGIQSLIWDEFGGDEIGLPFDKPLTLASYDAGPEKKAYVNFFAVGDELPETPHFLRADHYVPAPLEATYETTWKHYPVQLKGLLKC